MKARLTNKFSFGQIVVDPKSNSITLNGVEKRLEPKLISMLCLLAAQGRDVISRQEITQAIWPNVVVGEESITRAIFALRNALGDDAKQPQYIETIPKKGYRCLVDAEVVSEPCVLSVSPNSSITNKRPWIIYSAAMAIILILALFALWQGDKNPGVEIDGILPLNKMEGVERSISLNSEGTKLLFVHEADEKNDLYSRDLHAAKDTLWARDEFLKRSPIWIDDSTVAYIRQHGGETQLVRHYQGQPAQILYTSSKPILQLTMVAGESEEIFFLEFQNNNLIELKSLNLRNGKQQNWRDFTPGLPNKIGQLQYSMKPNTLLMVKDENENPAIVSLDLSTKKITLLNDRFSEISKIAAVSQHSFLVVGSLNAAEGIWLVEEQKLPQLVLRAFGSEKIVDAQIDIRRKIIFYANLQKNVDLKIVSALGQEALPMPGLNSSGMDISATFASNNRFIYFISNRAGSFDIWRYDLESQIAKQISTLNALSMTWYSLSHDGKKLAVGYRTDELYLGVVDVETGALQRKVKTPSYRYPLAWSYDDKTIYVSEHQAEVNLFSYDEATLEQSLFAEKSGLYVKALDENNLVYVDYKRHGLVERNFITQQEKVLHDTIPDLTSLSPGGIKLGKNNDGFYTSCQIEWVHKTCFYSLSENKSLPVVVSDTPYWHFSDITEDGGKVLAADVKPSSGDIMRMQLRH